MNDWLTDRIHDPHGIRVLEGRERGLSIALWVLMAITWLSAAAGLLMAGHLADAGPAVKFLIFVVCAGACQEASVSALRAMGYWREVPIEAAMQLTDGRPSAQGKVRSLVRQQAFITATQFALCLQTPEEDEPPRPTSVFDDLASDLAAHEFTR